MKNIIQIAGIKDAEEAKMLIEEGVDWLGFPLRLPSGLDDISEMNAKKIISELPENNKGILISYLTNADEIIEFCDYLGVHGVQVHGDISLSEMIKLRKNAKKLFILKSLVVKENNFDELLEIIDQMSPYVDMFITDTFDPKTGAKGATGKTHDWNVSKKISEYAKKPLMMAGGLSNENVSDAINFVRPHSIDAHSLVEDESGRKSREKIKLFVQKAKQSFSK
ncbi:N-(5'-phosphoribosyl)anthranilate isomerase [Acinetobacter sp. AM]|uniref:phosphoribosylanthranilate isomerase n=1 Tax=Acinetobacter sp. AM TaxID=2170730 RepID=UPI000DE71B18|nr:phosphoribosylanthranilate isomerase [Acinetobacter sp. AM]PWB12997.1 N-(5'-phosphoribosyl)anthranilate isomerase [Acinetobacter sp. AM]